MAPVTKRQRENSTGDLKAKVSDTSAIMKLINARFDEQADLIATKMKESEEHMMSIFHDRLDSLNGDFQSLQLRVQKLEQAAEESRALQAQIEMLEAKLAVQANASTVNDMRLHGVPYVEAIVQIMVMLEVTSSSNQVLEGEEDQVNEVKTARMT
ncbi:hypothetical protein ACLKA7_001940 [Drosophila subpalustris]